LEFQKKYQVIRVLIRTFAMLRGGLPCMSFSLIRTFAVLRCGLHTHEFHV